METWTGTRWFIEGDIKGCFDNIDHDVLLSVLGEKLHDGRFLRLLKYLLKAGYLEEWRYGRTLSGTPQGGVVSPILANVYLDRLDQFVEKSLIPAHTRGTDRRDNPAYTRLLNRMAYHRKVGHHSLAMELRKQMQQLPSRDPYDSGYRRLRYVRYADDFVLGFIGTKAEAKQVKESLEVFLRDTLKLELSREKTLITHATSQAARFLGYDLVNQQANDQLDPTGRRRVNGRIGLRVPAQVIEQHCRAYMDDGKPAHRSSLIHDDDFGIVYEQVSVGVPGRRPVLPPGLQRPSLRTPLQGHGTVADQNPSGQAQDQCTEDAPPLCGYRGYRARPPCLPKGHSSARRRQASTRGAVRWHSPETATAGRPRRPTASTIQVRPHRAHQTAPRGRVRVMRVNGEHTSPPHPCTS